MKQEYELLKQYDDVITPAEVKEILGIGKNSMYALLSDGKIKSFKVGSHIKITKTSLLEYLQNSQ